MAALVYRTCSWCARPQGKYVPLANARSCHALQVGDAWQLPPCGCRHKLDEETDTAICPHCHLLYSDEFLSARHQHLQAVWRQAADPTFTRFLNHVRTRRPTAEYIQEVLGACMRPREELASLLTPDATILCTHRWAELSSCDGSPHLQCNMPS